MNKDNDGVSIVMCDNPDHAPQGLLGPRTDDQVCHGCHILVKCIAHDELFVIRAWHHLGDNEEKFAYGCPRCDRERVVSGLMKPEE